MRSIARIGIAAAAGAWIACVVAALVTYGMFAAGGYTTEAVVELPGWAFAAIGGGGALVGLVIAIWRGRSPLPAWVRPVALGGLAGVALVVTVTYAVARELGGPAPKGQARYLASGAVYGIPAGLIGGAVAGLLAWRRRRHHEWR
jgi:hypothetical protein